MMPFLGERILIYKLAGKNPKFIARRKKHQKK